ncbi:hypothetical protein ACHAW5_005945 [Stephanodiscus triporus]|uniref:Chitin-binding type-2 domain-containing protein n=1 Tax=Stephanodiscus triporus TaxID=2934178 RepID=A0ABD3NE72_9STRA
MIVTRRVAAVLLCYITCSAGNDVAIPGEDTISLHEFFEGYATAQRGTQRRRLENRGKRKRTEDGGYDCTSHSLENSCENVDGYDLLPLLPTACRQYAICRDQRIAFTFDCPEGRVFDHRVKKCLSEEMAYCPCQKFSASNSIDEPNQSSSWYTIHSDKTKYVWITDGGDRSWSNSYRTDFQSSTPSKSIKSSDDSYFGDVVRSSKSGKASNNSSKGAKEPPIFGKAAKSSKRGKSSKSEHGFDSVLPPLEPIPPPPTMVDTNEPPAENTINRATTPPSAILPINGPTISQTTTSPSAILSINGPTIALPSNGPTMSPTTAPPSAILSINSPTIAPSPPPRVDTTEPTARSTISPNTTPPSALLPSNGTTITPSPPTKVATTEPTAANTISPTTTSPSAILTSNGPTIALTLTVAPSQQPSTEPCISGSENETFEGGVFPISPWTTGGDGNWTIHEGNTNQGNYSIKSPDLSGATSIAAANVSVSTCANFSGAAMSIGLLAGGVLPPTDAFSIYIDGVEVKEVIEYCIHRWYCFHRDPSMSIVLRHDYRGTTDAVGVVGSLRPEWISTHPGCDAHLSQFDKWMPEALERFNLGGGVKCRSIREEMKRARRLAVEMRDGQGEEDISGNE